MATIKIKFRPSSINGKEGTLYYQVIHNRIVRSVSTNYKLFPDEWDKAASTIRKTADNLERNRYLNILAARIEEDTERLRVAIRKLEQSGYYTPGQIVAAYLASDSNSDFIAYARKEVDRTRRMGKVRTAEAYASSLNSFQRFWGEQGDMAFEDIDAALMTEYEAYLEQDGKCPNTVSFYMRNLRTLYNRAVEEGLTENRFPFRRVNTRVEKTVKRAVTAEIIARIKELELSLHPALEFTRDLFLLCFYLRGMSFVDLAFLKKKDLQNGVLVYRRRKTGQQLCIKWEPFMQEIVRKYSDPESPYMLPIIKESGKDERRQYLNASHLMNRKLKKIGRMIGCPIKLTFYVSRHGWASIAQSQHIPLPVISEALGHDSEDTTRIYLALLDTAVVDRANSKVINSIVQQRNRTVLHDTIPAHPCRTKHTLDIT
ncbi:site-specific integrase [Bacteroides sp. An51A]|uniref:site-specific integrase n=1 Tax=Bacteroides sp. An51A TaxID=1965640 RepID=UPI000B37A4A6|nr:site-specific integrase [Bacteroides sp. An51A]OUN80462.1 integrase [Bacteroides sp. An51A]